jgi:lysophospholipid acyltransferase (LPLAT)-like uncharacterized protein
VSDRAARRARRDRWLARLGALVLRLLARTWRVRIVNDAPLQALRAAHRPYIHCIWHGEMLPLLWAFRGEGAAVLISEHGDGEIIAQAAISLGYRTVRGSSSRGAERALLELTRVLNDGGHIAVTPDGPRGPRHSFAPGALIVAQRTGAPVVLTRAFSSRVWQLKSWDRFEIPKPFARVTVVNSDPGRLEATNARDAAAQADAFAAAMERVAPPAVG